RFAYLDSAGNEHLVQTLEETEYPGQYHQTPTDHIPSAPDHTTGDAAPKTGAPQADHADIASGQQSRDSATQPKEQHLVFQENQKGLSYDKLFRPYLLGATQITLTDPYLRLFYQVRNLMEFVETL